MKALEDAMRLAHEQNKPLAEAVDRVMNTQKIEVIFDLFERREQISIQWTGPIPREGEEIKWEDKYDKWRVNVVTWLLDPISNAPKKVVLSCKEHKWGRGWY